MPAWVEKILKSYVPSKLDGIVLILLLGMNHSKMMESVFFIIKLFVVEAVHILCGCMGLCQPVDVGINKSLKSEV